MPSSFDMGGFARGFCWGMYEPKLDSESRLRLPKETLDVMRQHDVEVLYACPDPASAGFVLCPDKNWRLFISAVQKHVAADDAERAYRLVCARAVASIDSQGRIRIRKACLDYAEVDANERVKLLGVGVVRGEQVMNGIVTRNDMYACSPYNALPCSYLLLVGPKNGTIYPRASLVWAGPTMQ